MSVSKVDDEKKPVRLPLDEKPDRYTLTIHPDISAQRSLTPDRVVSNSIYFSTDRQVGREMSP